MGLSTLRFFILGEDKDLADDLDLDDSRDIMARSGGAEITTSPRTSGKLPLVRLDLSLFKSSSSS